MNQTNHFARIDTHRVQLMELEAKQCAPEGAWTPIPPKKAPRIPRETSASVWVGPVLGALSLSAVAILSYVALVVA